MPLPRAGSLLGLVALTALAFACNTATLKKSPSLPGEDEGDGGVAEVLDTGLDADVADTGSTTRDGAPLPFPVSHDVRIVVEPSDSGAALLAAVRAAKTSIHVTMYILTQNDMSAALIAQKRAGLDVKVVLNQAFPTSGNLNQTEFTKLQKAGVEVVWAPPNFDFTHAKCIVIDALEAWVMTMNAAETTADVNREYLAIDRDPTDVAQAERIFGGDFKNAAVDTGGPLLVSPTSSKGRILDLIASAERSLDMEAESLAQDETVAGLVAAQARGVAVRVVHSDDFSSANEQQTLATLKAAKVPIVTVAKPYIHAKAIVVDGVRAYVGSVNFTNTSYTRNREIGVIFDGAGVASVASTIAADFAIGKAP